MNARDIDQLYLDEFDTYAAAVDQWTSEEGSDGE